MKTVGAFEAKTRLNELLRRVSSGETIRITRRGIPVAKLVPLKEDDKEDVAKAVQELREIRKRLSLGGLSIRELIDEGRRY
ncbi:MAG TPA: type II toxin-antitoxin system prevent-host-death family antitoxin [Candidatus Binatia bacterium]|nr:type II toxin-antitoxin system prevent-host-death family antitoxin [Candidatus Binatia bacterium]